MYCATLHGATFHTTVLFDLKLFTMHNVGAEAALSYSVSLQTARPEFDHRQSQRIFPLVSVSKPTQPPVHWVSESFPGSRARAGLDADHLPLTSDEVKNE
jgi:hypothetical protein